MQSITITNVLGVRSARIQLVNGEIVHVRGPNGAGKSSLAQAVAAVLARNTNPAGLSAIDARRWYINQSVIDDVGHISVVLEDEDGIQTTWWAGRGVIDAPTDSGPISHPAAVGLVNFIDRQSAKARAEMIQRILLTDDEIREQARERLASTLDAVEIEDVVKLADERGWDAVASIYEDRGRRSKREWQSITGHNYGVRVAADWRPSGWLADYDAMTVQDAETKVVEARDALGILATESAISETEAAAAESARERLPALRDALSEREAALAAAQGDVAALGSGPVYQANQTLNRLRDELAGNEEMESQPCPHCGESLYIASDRVLRTWDEEIHASLIDELKTEIARVEDEERAERAAREEHQQKREQLNGLVTDASAAVGAARTELRAAERDAERSGHVETAAMNVARSRAEQDVEDARKVVEIIKAEAEAARLHETISRYTSVASLLGPLGIRRSMMDRQMAVMNKTLERVTELAEWPSITLADDGNVSVDGRPVLLCSASERWRAQVALQLAIAAMTQSGVCVIDGIDILDSTNRDGLLRATQQIAERTKMAILVCETDEPDGAPVGTWIVNGEVIP